MSVADARHRLDAVVSGRVQGVGYRWFTSSEASRLGCVGWVANQHDGTVRVVAEGSRVALERLEAVLRVGPAGARVDDVRAQWDVATDEYSRFAVRPGSHPGD